MNSVFGHDRSGQKKHDERSEMTVYVIADIEVNDRDAYAEYQKKVPAIIEKYGGRYLVRGGDVTVIEGEWQPSRIVVLEFPSQAELQRFAKSPEYAPVAAIRHRATKSNSFVVEGYAGH
jgi:uncharacterized protein (DUF1330 family)